jgi:hypothetical protein
MVTRTPQNENSIILETKDVLLSSLNLYHKNPRVGDVDAIAISLEENGQYKPIVVNKGTKTGRKNEILGGNHTYLAARKELTYRDSEGNVTTKKPWKKLLVSFVDVSEEEAVKIVLADNKTGMMGGFDENLLAELLSGVEDVTGTGYKQEEVDDILAGLPTVEDMDDVIDEIEDHQRNERHKELEEKRSRTFDGAALGDESGPDDEEWTEEDEEEFQKTSPGIEDQPEELQGLFQFKPPESLVFEGTGFFGIPKLRKDMLMTFDDLPEGLESWAGSASKDDDDPDRWWLYNWGIDSTSGMKDISKVIVSFYAFDDYFDNWWYYPEKYFTKILNSRIKYMLTPNWSQSSDLPKVEALWALYRARWIGRYAQEVGIKLCPDITWIDGDIEWLEKYVLSTLPKGLPLIAMQWQTIDPEKVSGGIEHLKDQIALVLEKLQPEGALIYTGKLGKEIFTEVYEDVAPKLKVRFLETRMNKLSEQQKGRTRKKTI